MQENDKETKTLEWLDQFNKQASKRQNNSINLQEQLKNLSHSFNQAQQKILQIEKQLMIETFYTEKQRSLIQLLKHMLEEDMEDETILSFIVSLQESTDKSHDIQAELIEIKQILQNRKKIQNKSKTILQLRRQVTQNVQLNTHIIEEYKKISIQRDELKKQIQSIKDINKSYEIKINQYSLTIQKQILQLNAKNILIQETSESNVLFLKNEKQYIKFFQKIKQLIKIDNKINFNQLSSQNNNIQLMLCIQQNLINILKRAINYRKTCKQLEKHFKEYTFLEKQILIIKQYLSKQAINLIEQYEKTKQECLEYEISCLAKLQRKKLSNLELCYGELQKCKIQLLHQSEKQNISINPTIQRSQLKKNNDLEWVDNSIFCKTQKIDVSEFKQ